MVTRSLIVALGVLSMGATYYCDPTGDDGSGDGSAGTPYLTVAQALTVATGADTIFVRAGEYIGVNAPWGVVLDDRALNGIWIVGGYDADGNGVVFDPDSLGAAGADSSAFIIDSSSHIVEDINFRDLSFRDYPVWSRSQGRADGVIRIEHSTLSDSVMTRVWLQNLRAYAADYDSVMPLFQSELPAGADDGYLDSLTVLSCVSTDAGATGILANGNNWHTIIEGCTIALNVIVPAIEDEPSAIHLGYTRGWADDARISFTNASGADHGIAVRGARPILHNNTSHHHDDDAYWVYEWRVGTDAASLFVDNIGYYLGDDGIQIGLPKSGVYANTLYAFYGSGISDQEGLGKADSSVVRWNIISNNFGNDAAPQTGGPNLQSWMMDFLSLTPDSSATIQIRDNVFYDRDGPGYVRLKTVIPNEPNIYTIATLDTLTQASNNFDGLPALADTIEARNLRPLRNSPARGRGPDGRWGAGALECADCLKMHVSVDGIEPDSLGGMIDAQDGSRLRDLTAASFRTIEPFSRYVVEIDADIDTPGEVIAQAWHYSDASLRRHAFGAERFLIVPPAEFASETDALLAARFTTLSNLLTTYYSTLNAGHGSLSLAQTLMPLNIWRLNLDTATYQTGTAGYKVKQLFADWLAGGLSTDLGQSASYNTLIAQLAVDAAEASGTLDEWETRFYQLALESTVAVMPLAVQGLLAGDFATVNDGIAALPDTTRLETELAEIEDHGDTFWVGGGGAGGTGTGDLTHMIRTRSDVDSSLVVGARVTLYTEGTRYVNWWTDTAGLLHAHLDTLSYAAVVSKPGDYHSWNGVITVTGDADTTDVYLEPIEILPPVDPTNTVVMIFRTTDLWGGGPVDSVKIETQPQCTQCAVSGHGVSTGWKTQGFTDANGQLTFPLQRSSTISAPGADVWRRHYKIRATDLRTTNKVWTTVTYANVLAPATGDTAVVLNNVGKLEE